MRTMELTIIERASPGSERSRSSSAITLSAALAPLTLAEVEGQLWRWRLAGERLGSGES